MEIPFHRTYTTDDEIIGVVEAIKSGWLTMGPKTVELEQRLREYLGSPHTVCMNSCTACLHLALLVAGIGEGDEVIIPTNTFTATGEVVTYLRARPVIVDVERDTHNIALSAIERAITTRTRAIIPVHFAGQPCNMDEIIELVRNHDLHVIEDAAHALPARYKGRMIGTIGDITCFSFYATKTLSTGEGGAAATANEAWSERMKILRLHGISRDAWKRYSKEGSWYYEVVEAGYKYNMTDIQAGLGLPQLEKVDWMWRQRISIAGRYTEAFSAQGAIEVPTVKTDRETAWHLYVIKLNLDALTIDRAAFIEQLAQKGICASVHFIPLHRHPYYRDTFGCTLVDYPNSEWIYERCISLPIYPGMTDEEVAYVIDTVLDICHKWRR